MYYTLGGTLGCIDTSVWDPSQMYYNQGYYGYDQAYMHGYDQYNMQEQYSGYPASYSHYPVPQYSNESTEVPESSTQEAQQSTVVIEPGAVAANEDYKAQVQEYENRILSSMSDEDRKQYEGMSAQEKEVYLQQWAMYEQQEAYNAAAQVQYDSQVESYQQHLVQQMSAEDKAQFDAMSAEEKRAYVEQMMVYHQQQGY